MSGPTGVPGPSRTGRGRPRARGAAPPARAGGGSVFLLPPWIRAPLLAFGQPAVILAVVGAAAILACAASSASLFLSSSSSEALHRTIAAECADASHPVVTDAGDIEAIARTVPPAMAAHGLAPTSRLILSPDRGQPFPDPVHGRFDGDVRLLYGDGALDQVTMLDRGPGNGVVIARDASVTMRAGVGDTITFNGVGLPVVGVFQNLYEEPVRDYWCSRTGLFITPCYGCDGAAPPPLAIFTDPTTAAGFYRDVRAATARQGGLIAPPTVQYTSAIGTDHLTLSDARDIVDRQRAVYADIGSDLATQHRVAPLLGQLPAMTDRVGLIRDGLTGPVVPIALGGALLALLLVGAAGSYWADRRSREVRLLSSRGVGPGGLAAKAALELTVPALVGTALGVLLARWLISVLGPSPDLDSAAPRAAVLTAAAGFVAGVALLSAVAGLRARNATERPLGARRSWLALVPWEVLLLAAAAVCYLRLRSTDPIVLKGDVAQVNLLLMLFPLLFLAGAAVLVVRLLTGVLRPLRRRSGRWPVAVYLAVSRITAAPVVSVTLLAAICMPVAMVVYSAGLTATSSYTVEAKAKVFTGSDTAVTSVDQIPATPQIDRLGTVVDRYDDIDLGGTEGTVLAVNPRTLPGTAFWDERFAERSLDELMADLRVPEAGGPVPAVMVKSGADVTSMRLGDRNIPVDVVDRARVFPGLRLDQPMLVVNAAALGDLHDSASRFSELWSTRGVDEVQETLAGAGVRVFTVSTREKVLDLANFLAVTWSFGYLQALAALVGVVAVGGLLLYLETRQRARTTSYTMTRRMGLSGRSHLRSMLCEMAMLVGVATLVGVALAWTAVVMVYGRMDIDELRPPEPLLTAPVPALVGTALAAVAVCVLAAAYAHRSARRADASEVLRLG